MDIEWADVLRASLSFFLIIVGIGIAYVCFRFGGMLSRMTQSVHRVTDEVVPILNRAQTTVDGINLELQRVDEIMVSAVNATKGAERTVTSISHAVTAPVRKASGFAAAAKEAMSTFRARRAAGPHAPAAEPAPAGGTPTVTGPAPPAAPSAREAPPADVAAEHNVNGAGHELPEELPPEVRNRSRGPSISQISWALPKRGS